MASRRRAWVDTVVSGTIVAGGAQPALIDLLAAGMPSDTLTVIRMIGNLSVVPQDASLNVQSQQHVFLGVGVSSVEAFAVGNSVLPTPGIVAEQPPRGWLYLSGRLLTYQNSATFGVEDYLYPSFNFDVRASRKIDKGTLFLVQRNVDVFAMAMIVRVVGIIRVLCLT